MYQTENIKKYLQAAYSDEKLAALRAHTEDGKLGYGSCCCFIGGATADHALQEAPGIMYLPAGTKIGHYAMAYRAGYDFTAPAEIEFKNLGRNDAERRERLLPLIESEMERRNQLCATAGYSGDAGDEQVEVVIA